MALLAALNRQPVIDAGSGLSGAGADGLHPAAGPRGLDTSDTSRSTITLRVYAHLWPGDEDRTRTHMDAALGQLTDISRTFGASS